MIFSKQYLYTLLSHLQIGCLIPNLFFQIRQKEPHKGNFRHRQPITKTLRIFCNDHHLTEVIYQTKKVLT